MSAVMENTERRRQKYGPEYEQLLQTLSQGSVDVHFDPYLDIAWDSPEFVIDPHDADWVLAPDLDPLGATAWYQAQPLEKQIQIGMWRQANAVKVGSNFESMLIRGLMQYAMAMPNGSPEFRYCMHEMTEECNHIQMFQELVNRIGIDVPGMRPTLRVLSPVIGMVGAFVPPGLMIGILAGEEPIDHYQKSLIRSGRGVPAPVLRAMEIHIAEEARHISFAAEYLRVRVPQMRRDQRAVCGILFPLLMRWLCDELIVPPPAFRKEFDVPKSVMKEAFWDGPVSREVLSGFFADMRALATDLGLMNRQTRWLWRAMKIDGPPSRFRGEPDRTAAVI
jgi:para-aminobenzoate N-oxygenase AurF